MSQAFGARSLAMVASALTEDYGVQVTIGGKEAFTGYASNRKPVINIPAVTIRDPDYTTMVRGYIDHETGHIRFTMAEESAAALRRQNKINSAAANLANIFEDVMVERLMGECFPGCKRNLRKMVELIFCKRRKSTRQLLEVIDDRNDDIIVSTRKMARNIISAIYQYVLYRVRSDAAAMLKQYVPEYREQLDEFVPGLAEELEPALSRVWTEGTNTMKNVALATEAERVIHDFLRQNTTRVSDLWRHDSKQSKYASDGRQPQENISAENSPGAGGDQEGRSVLDAIQDLMDHEKLRNDLDIASRLSDTINSVTVNTANAVISHQMTVYSPGDDYWKASLQHLTDKDIQESLRASAALDAQLQSLLQAFVLHRGGVSRAGRLDTNKLHRLAVGNDRIFKRRIERRGINTEVILCIDMSGSMSGEKADLTSRALYAVMSSLRKIRGVTSSAIGFSGTFIVEIIRPQDKLTTRMLIDPNGGTYCGEALMHAVSKFTASPETRKIAIMMTDGDTQNPKFFEQAILIARDEGIELAGIGIIDHKIAGYLPAEECCIINNLNEIIPELFKILRKKLLRI